MKIKSVLNSIRLFFMKNLKKTIFIGVALITLLIFSFLKGNTYISEEWFATSISRYSLWVISSIVNIIPFSVTELFYVVAIISLIVSFVKIIKSMKTRSWELVFQILYKITAVAVGMILMINLVFTFSYNRYPLGEELALEKHTITMENAVESSAYYIGKAKSLEDKFERDETGAVISPYSFNETVELVRKEYERLDSDYFNPFTVKPKKMMFSSIMSYMGFTGVFFPFFAEVNINVKAPAYGIPVTICHEMAHSKGVMRENEANFVAYYLLITSENEYLQYCGYMHASSRMLNETYDPNDRTYYDDTRELISEAMWGEYNASYTMWDSYDTFVDDIFNWINNFYLTSSGVTSGVKSYSQTGEFLVRLYYTIQNGNLKY